MPDARLRVHWFTKWAILALDRLLRRYYHVYEYTDDIECIFRIALRTARSDILLQPGMLIRSGDTIVELHLWNEQLPLIPPDGANMAWGASVDRQIRRSLTLLATHLVANQNVVAVHGEAAFGCRMGQQQSIRFAGRYGFEIVDGAPRLRSRVRHFCDDFLFLGLTQTFNPYGLKGKSIHRTRYHIWMSRIELDRRWSTTATGDRATAENRAV
ncbi:MAG: YkoP family protein [Stellaceae bacterium]